MLLNNGYGVKDKLLLVMIQEVEEPLKDLLIKDLCARLPYRVKLQSVHNIDSIVKLYSINLDDYCHEIKYYTYEGKALTICDASKLFRCGKFLRYKPCLFPLSSMAEEQQEELITITDGKFRYMWGVITNAIPRKNTGEWGISENAFIDGIEVINILYIWLLKNHFDINGLIEKGLAIDASNLNIY